MRIPVSTMACAAVFAAVCDAQSSVPSGECNQPAAETIAYVDLPGNPFMAIPASDGCSIFVSMTAGTEKAKPGIAVLRRAHGVISLDRVVSVRGDLSGMTLTHDGGLLIVANGKGVLFIDPARLISGKGHPVLGHINDLFEIPADTARFMGPKRAAQTREPGSNYVNVTADDQFLFVSDEWAQAITVIDLHKGLHSTSIVGRIPVGVLPIALTFSPDQKLLYTTSQVALKSSGWPIECKPEGGDASRTELINPQGTVTVIDVAKAKIDPANSVISNTPAGCTPVRLALSPNGETAFVTVRNSNEVFSFDTAKLVVDPAHALVGRVPVGPAPVGIGVVDDGRKVIVTNSNRFSGGPEDKLELTVIDAAKTSAGAGAILGSIPAGAFPREIRTTPDRLTLLVTNWGSKSLEIVDLKRLRFPDKARN